MITPTELAEFDCGIQLGPKEEKIKKLRSVRHAAHKTNYQYSVELKLKANNETRSAGAHGHVFQNNFKNQAFEIGIESIDSFRDFLAIKNDANFKPKVIGSACMPCLRPIHGVNLYFLACFFLLMCQAVAKIQNVYTQIIDYSLLCLLHSQEA